MGSDREPFSEPPGHGSGLSLPFCLLLEVLARVRLGGGADDSCSRNSSLDPEDHQPKKGAPTSSILLGGRGDTALSPRLGGEGASFFHTGQMWLFPKAAVYSSGG